mmetsp:Transcript_63751/g.126035  ORF Transcript_63751/g.126035 Transcript_63751/m.126035 type:complete len:113 (+) Transcript_63751:1109-1447(+)
MNDGTVANSPSAVSTAADVDMEDDSDQEDHPLVEGAPRHTRRGEASRRQRDGAAFTQAQPSWLADLKLFARVMLPSSDDAPQRPLNTRTAFGRDDLRALSASKARNRHAGWL